MELIQCSELSSRLTDLNKIQEHITPEGRSWPRARVGSHLPTFHLCLVLEVVALPVPSPKTSLRGFGVPSHPSLHPHKDRLSILGGFGAPKDPAHPCSRGNLPCRAWWWCWVKAEHELQEREIPGGSFCDRDRRNQTLCILFFGVFFVCMVFFPWFLCCCFIQLLAEAAKPLLAPVSPEPNLGLQTCLVRVLSALRSCLTMKQNWRQLKHPELAAVPPAEP